MSDVIREAAKEIHEHYFDDHPDPEVVEIEIAGIVEFIRAKLEAAVPWGDPAEWKGLAKANIDGWNECRAKLGLGGER